MILHIFSDSPYTEKFIRFINKYFDSKEHLFIVLSLKKDSKFLDFYKSQSNCKITNSKSMYFKHAKEFKSSKQIIIHQLNKPILMLNLLLFYPKAYKKMVWSIWGGDVYFYKYKSNSLKDNLLELLRKIVIKKIPVISYWIKGDYETVSKVYKTNALGINAKYPSPVDLDKIINIKPKKQCNNEIIIIVGNSGDESNEHIEIFNMLKKHSNENIKIYTILSYGGSKEYIRNVIRVGKNIFQDKFISVTSYMDFGEYLDFLNQCDICILNHKRQQGLGNQLIYLALNKKLFIDSSTTPFNHYRDLDIEVFDSKVIDSLSFENFIFQVEKSKDKNKVNILNNMEDSTIAKEWGNVFILSRKDL